MNKDSLISLADRPLEERQAIARKGGQAKSLRKKFTSRANVTLSRGSQKKIERLLKEPKHFAVNIVSWLQQIQRNPNLTLSQQIELGKALCLAYRTFFGDKVIMYSLESVAPQQVIDRISEYKKEERGELKENDV